MTNRDELKLVESLIRANASDPTLPGRRDVLKAAIAKEKKAAEKKNLKVVQEAKTPPPPPPKSVSTTEAVKTVPADSKKGTF